MLISICPFWNNDYWSLNRRISEIYPANILMISNKDYLTFNEPFQFKFWNVITHKSKKIIHKFMIISLCTIFCNFVKESTSNIIEFSWSSNLNKDISLTNTNSFSKLISFIARFLFYIFSHFGAHFSFSTLYKNWYFSHQIIFKK